MSIWQMSLSASAIIVIAVIIRALAINRLPKKTFLALWGLALCRLLIPCYLPSRFSVYSLLERVGAVFSVNPMPEISAFRQVIDTEFDAVGLGLTAKGGTGIASGLLLDYAPYLVWLVGTLACVVFFAVSYWKCRREFQASLPTENEYIRRWQDRQCIKRSVAMRVSDRIASPLTYGMRRPVILLPKGMDFTDETKLNYILAHEYVHIRRFDSATKLLLTAAVCVHWFNPFAWVMYILANRDIELSCDETVVRSFGDNLKSTYAMMLIGMEEAKNAYAPLFSNFSKYAIEERINAIMKIKKTSLAGIIIACALVIGTAAIFATSGVGVGAAATDENGIYKTSSRTVRSAFFGNPGGDETTSSQQDMFYLTVTHNFDFQIYEIHARWYVGGEFAMGQGVTAAEGSDFAADESVSFPIERGESGIEDETGVEVEFEIQTEDSVQVTTRIPITVTYGETYELDISKIRQTSVETPTGHLDEMPAESSPNELDHAPAVDWESVDPKIKDVIYKDTFGTGREVRLLSVGVRDESKFTPEEWEIIMLAVEQGLVYWEE